MLDQTTLYQLVAMLSKKVAELETDLSRTTQGENDAVNELNSVRRQLWEKESEFAKGDRVSYSDYDKLRCENAKLQQTIREMANKLLGYSEDAKTIKFRYDHGDLKGKKIDAIRKVRAATQCGLREAKDYIEAV
jgi:hypothetical protein